VFKSFVKSVSLRMQLGLVPRIIKYSVGDNEIAFGKKKIRE